MDYISQTSSCQYTLVYNMLGNLSVRSRTQAVLWARELSFSPRALGLSAARHIATAAYARQYQPPPAARLSRYAARQALCVAPSPPEYPWPQTAAMFGPECLGRSIEVHFAQAQKDAAVSGCRIVTMNRRSRLAFVLAELQVQSASKVYGGLLACLWTCPPCPPVVRRASQE
jgi:hypothetical protein